VARDFPTARVLLYMYESAWKGSLKVKQSIDNLAMTLLHGLDEKRVFNPEILSSINEYPADT
jgi:hypothetical protein